jgi:hypothetical protein
MGLRDLRRSVPADLGFLFILLAVAALVLHAEAQVQEEEEPGTLLLNMLTKNEAEHLSRSLPKWAPLIDYWIIGIGACRPFGQCPNCRRPGVSSPLPRDSLKSSRST